MLKDKNRINMPKTGMSGTFIYLLTASAKRHHQSGKPHDCAVFSMPMYSVRLFFKMKEDLLTVT